MECFKYKCLHFNSKVHGYACYIDHLNLDSSNYRIDEIVPKHEPDRSDADIESIYFWNSNFEFLPSVSEGYIRKKFRNVYKIFIDGDQSRVSLSSLTNAEILTDIRVLTLSKFGAKMSKISPNLLSRFMNLLEFYSNGNEIEDIPSIFFKRNTQLTTIEVSLNRLQHLSEDLLVSLHHLSSFGANRNRISSLSENFFSHNIQLRRVRLHFNLLTSLPARIFSQNINLEAVDFDHNHITYLPESLFSNNRNLKEIRVADNKISSLPPNLLANSPLLVVFQGEDNLITQIPLDFTRNNKNLRLCSCLTRKISHVQPQYQPQPQQFYPQQFQSQQAPNCWPFCRQNQPFFG